MQNTRPSRTKETECAYERTYGQLKRKAKACMTTAMTPENFAHWVTRKRAELAPSSWRKLRAVFRYGLEHELAADEQLRPRITAAMAIVERAPATARPKGELATSQMKAKRFEDGDLDRLRHAALASRSPHGGMLADYLLAGTVTGLREAEWPSAEFRHSQTSGFAWELFVHCAKATNGRAHGETRTLRWTGLDDEILAAITNWLAEARQADAELRYDTLLGTLSSLLYRLTRKLWPRRKRRPTLYTVRHEAAARWKACYAPVTASEDERLHGLAVVAALLGHASDETATRHYGRPRRGERGSSRFPVPTADPLEVARVRRRMDLNPERFEALTITRPLLKR